MPGSFYYTPIDPGYDRGPAAGIAAGINQGVQNFSSGLEHQQAIKRQQDEVAYRQGRDKVADQQHKQMFDLNLAEHGGGEGQAPTSTQTTDVPIAAQQLPQPSYGTVESRGAHGGMAGGVDRPAPQFGTSWMKQNVPQLQGMSDPGTLKDTQTVADPRYQQIGDFYIQSPEYTAEQASQRATAGRVAEIDATSKGRIAEDAAKTAEKESERRATSSRIAASLLASHPSMSRTEAESEAELLSSNSANYGDLHPHYAPRENDPTKVNATSAFTAKTEAARDRSHQLNELSAYNRQYQMKPDEYKAAQKEIEDRYNSVMESIDGKAAPAAKSKTTDAGQSAAQPHSMFDMSNIDEFVKSVPHGDAAPAPKGAAKTSKPAAAAPAPAAPPAPAADTVAQAREYLKKIPAAKQRQALIDAGFDEAHIKKILPNNKAK